MLMGAQYSSLSEPIQVFKQSLVIAKVTLISFNKNKGIIMKRRQSSTCKVMIV